MNLKEVIVLVLIMTIFGLLASAVPLWARWGFLGIVLGVLFNYVGNKRRH